MRINCFIYLGWHIYKVFILIYKHRLLDFVTIGALTLCSTYIYSFQEISYTPAWLTWGRFVTQHSFSYCNATTSCNKADAMWRRTIVDEPWPGHLPESISYNFSYSQKACIVVIPFRSAPKREGTPWFINLKGTPKGLDNMLNQLQTNTAVST
jgi:hypothetical protein